MRTNLIILILFFSTIGRTYSIDFSGIDFYLSEILLALYYVLYFSEIKNKFLYLIFFIIPFLSLYRYNITVNDILFGGYELVYFYLIFSVSNSIDFNKINFTNLSIALNSIIVFYVFYLFSQLFLSNEINLYLNDVFNSSEKYAEKIENFTLNNIVRKTLNFSVATTAAGHIFMISLIGFFVNDHIKYKYKNLFLFLGFLVCVGTLTRHVILPFIIILFFLGLNQQKKASYFYLFIIFIALIIQVGLYDFFVERAQRGFDDNFNARFDIGIRNFSYYMLTNPIDLFFGLGIGKLYSLGPSQWNNYGFVSNGLLLYWLQNGIIFFLYWIIRFVKIINKKNFIFIIGIFVIFISDNYSFLVYTFTILFLFCLKFIKVYDEKN